MRKIGGFLSAILIGFLFVATVATPSNAAPRKHTPRPAVSIYDGLWSVSIFTQFGPCDPSYRYPARISAGQVLQVDDDFNYQLYGIVTSNGQISVTVSRGGQNATGYGQLLGSKGGGFWTAAGGQCSGSWTAVRRQ